MTADVEITELSGELSSAAEAELAGTESNPFDSDGSLRWRDKDRYLVVRDGDGRLAAAAGLVVAAVTVGDAQPLAVAGVGGVIVRADRRGEGLARAVVQAALQRAATLGPDRAMLFCWPDRAGLYERLGFSRITAAVTVGQPDARVVAMHMETMWRALGADVRWPAGPVALDGLPF